MVSLHQMLVYDRPIIPDPRRDVTPRR